MRLCLVFGWVTAVTVVAGGTAVATASELPQQLRSGAPSFERELAGGGAQSYLIAPDISGDLVLTVDQQGIDVTVSIRQVQEGKAAVPESDVQSLLTIDTPNGRWGKERLLFSASNAVSYVLEIRSLHSSASAGLYTLELESILPRDTRILGAHRASTEGSRLFFEGTESSRRLALEKYQEAYLLWQATERLSEEGDTLFHIAMLHRFLKQPKEALELHRRALGIRQQQGDRRGEARSWLEIGSTAWAMGESQHSPGAYRKALDLFRLLDDLHGQARALNYLGLVLARKDPRQALPFYQEALTLFQQTGDSRQEGVVLNNLGGLQGLLGEPHAALSRYREALAIHQARGDLAQQAAVWNNMGSTYRRTGRLQEALEYFSRSLDARRQLGDRRGEGRVLNNLGLVSLHLGDLERAERSFHQALLAKQEGRDRRGEAVTLLNLGFLHAERDQWTRALTSYEQALELQRATSDRRSEATTLIEMGRATAELGRPAAAKRHLQEALTLLEALDNPWRLGLAKAALGQVFTDFGQPTEAVVVLEESLELLRHTGDGRGTLASLLALARAEGQSARVASSQGVAEQKRLLVAAWRHTEEALDLLDTLRTHVDSLGQRMSFLSRHGDAFTQAIDLAMRLHDLEPAADWSARGLEISERSKARSLLDLLEESTAAHRLDVDATSIVDATLVKEQRTLLDRLNAKVERQRRHLKRGGNEAEVQQLGDEILQVSASLDDLENAIRRQSPKWNGLTHPRPLEAKAIQALVGSDTMLLEYALGTPKSFLWAITEDDIQSYELSDSATIERAARDMYEAYRVYDPSSRSRSAQMAERLSNLLLAPLADRLGTQRLVIVADGATHFIPFAALPRPTPSVMTSQASRTPASQGALEPLIVQHEMVFLPSASVLGMQRELLAEPSKAKKTLAVVADPVFSNADPRVAASPSANDETAIHQAAIHQALPSNVARSALHQDDRLRSSAFERLPWSRWEAEAIAAYADEGQTSLALGFDANLQAIKDGVLRDHRMVHFATHGLVDSEHPELSGLAFSLSDARGRPQPGLLRLPEIYHLELDADLVVLSGCQTALGSEVRGEGLIGLTRGFFAAGARRLVASLWRVQDKATAELMDRFYRRLLSHPAGEVRPAAALREAQLELMNSVEYQDPYHWAPFALYGEWR